MQLTIKLEQLKFYAYHGVLPQERAVGNTFTLDLAITISSYEALRTDELSDTLNYAEVYEAVKTEMLIPSDLLEHVLGRVAHSLFMHWDIIQRLEMKLSKLNPPFTADLKGVSMCLNMTRDEYNTLFSVSL